MTMFEDIKTPALILDQRVMAKNIARMDAQMKKLGVDLRPHVKTNKSIPVSKLLTANHFGAVTVSTLAEAETFLEGGFTDILYAVGITPSKLSEVAELRSRGAALKVILDEPAVAREVVDWATAHQTALEVLVEVDVDGERAGLEPHDPALLEAAQVLVDAAHIDFRGLMTHAGGSYGCRGEEELRAFAAQEHDRMMQAVDVLKEAGISCDIVSVGSTPTALFAENLEGVTEVRAGVYVFFDLYQAGLGTCRVDEIALSVLTSVVGHKPSHNRLLVDAGGLALSKDLGRAPAGPDCGYGLVVDARTRQPIEGLVVAAVNQEHGMITTSDGSPINFSRYPVGTLLCVLPNHSCMMAAAHDHYNVVDGQGTRVIETWPRVNYW